MDARVNQTSRYGSVVAFSGHEFVKYEWRTVPAGFELEAERHPSLEVKADPEPEPLVEIVEMEIVPEPEPTPEPEPEPVKASRKRGKK
jgi:hypothetical protein